ncbi:MAG TPA: hypothetical protein DCQ26_12865 [Marinilabiliales bacterium]|nr:MAG: hypothetical protein A2W95_08900 [Bacteroidetes bacterium GWA2_40_14]HAM99492.1 hypothetical protein [Marinilabiliales bacterium]
MRKKTLYQKIYRQWLIRKALRTRSQMEHQNKKMEHTIQLMTTLFFIGLILTGIFGTPTLLSWWQISRIYIACAVLFFFFPNRWFPIVFTTHKELKILMSLCGVAPLITGILLMLNFTLAGNVHTEKFRVLNYKTYYNEGLMIIELENKQFQSHHELRKFSDEEIVIDPDSVRYTIKTGLFGVKVATDGHLIEKK